MGQIALLLVFLAFLATGDLARGFARLHQRQSCLSHKLFKDAIEALTILRADHRQCIGGFHGIGIAGAHDTFAAHPVHHFVDAAFLD